MISFGIDSETIEGLPMTLQFFGEGVSKIVFVNRKNSLDKFLDFCDRVHTSAGETVILWGHNLSFDLISFFYPVKEQMRDEKIDLELRDWKITGLYTTGLCYIFMRHKIKHWNIYILDTFRFFEGSLEKLAAIFCPDIPKLVMPIGLGSKKFTSKDKQFVDYAMRDAEIAHRIGCKIADLWREYDVRPSVSQAQMAARIFRHKFVTEEIPLQPRNMVFAALHSYHGGKNNLTVKRGYYKDVHSIDIVSAYPFAMSTFPSFTRRDLYKGLKGKNITSPVPELGIYKVTGIAAPCKWPVIFNHEFTPVTGKFSGLWITGYEINEGIRTGELAITDLFGYFYDREKDQGISAFKYYIDEFFKIKNNTTDKITREFAKKCLNALYGKFIQKNKSSVEHSVSYDLDTDTCTEDKSFVAGGLFNPFIASLITGHTRAYIHRLEHKYKAIHTATDGIISKIKPRPADLGEGLGAIKLEYSGDVYIFRNKCYIFYNDTANDLPSEVYAGKFIQKYAHHGFHGKIKVLEAMIRTGVFEYEYIKVNKLKESLKRGLQVNKFETRKAVLNLDK